MRQLTAHLSTTLLVLCALVMTVLVARRELLAPPLVVQTEIVNDWREYAAHGHPMGTEDAPTSVVVFSDFQCPACRLLAERLRSFQRSHPSRIQIKYRHYPLPGHVFARRAAQASECASSQGRFTAFHDALFASQPSIGIESWLAFASRAEVPDLAAFTRCLSKPDVNDAVEQDIAAGNRLGLRVTPTMLINDVEIRGTPSAEVLSQAIVNEAGRRGAPH